MADEDPDTSPWRRDDWLPDSAVPDASVFGRSRSTASDAAPAESEPSGRRIREDVDDGGSETTAPGSGGSLVRRAVAVGVIAALVVGSAGALLRDDGGSEESPSAEPVDEPSADVAADPTTTAAFDTPGIEVSGTVEPLPTPAAGVGVTADADLPADAGLPAARAGTSPAWAESVVPVPDVLAAVAPTEVVTLTRAGILNVTEFPGGRTRSLDVSSVGAQPQLAFGDETIVVFGPSTLIMIRDGEPVIETVLSDGIIFVQPWPSTGSFVVTTPATGPDTPERELVLRPDGRIEPLDPRLADDVVFWSRSFSPDGDVLVSRPGGVYAIAPDGIVRRISTGDLLATGDAHWAVEECDESLRCASSVVSWETGEVRKGELAPISSVGFIDPATRLSPDGRSVVYRADDDGSGQRRILDVATGATLDAGRINQLVYPDAWASDSSGIFISDPVLRFVDRSTGAISEITGLDDVRTVATGRFAR